jgi:TRAP-type C4-dicarboxylate transport system substrate-binding protein
VDDRSTSEATDSGVDGTRRKLLASVAGFGLAAPFVAGDRWGAENPITLRYTAHVPRSHGLYTQGFVPFADLVARETQGRLQLESYPDRLLHGPIDGFKAAVTGITDYTHSYITYQPGSFRLLHLPQLPFLFPSPQVASLVVEELYPRHFKTEFERMGVYFAHCDSTSPYNLISKTPIQRLEDLLGLKVRVTGGLSSDIFRELGAVPVVIAAAEIYPAFQRGIIDAVALSVSDSVAYRLHEIGRYYTKADINVTILHYCLNRRTFDSLPEELRVSFYQLLRIRSQLVVQNFYSGPAHERALTTLRDAGVSMFELDEAELDRWRAMVSPLRERYVSRYEDEGLAARDVVADMEALAQEFASFSNDDINARIRNTPVQGIIDL